MVFDEDKQIPDRIVTVREPEISKERWSASCDGNSEKCRNWVDDRIFVGVNEAEKSKLVLTKKAILLVAHA